MSDHKQRAIYFAASYGDEKELESLLSGTKIRIQKKDDGITALYTAVINGHENVARLLCKSKPDLIFLKDTEGRTPLHIAVYEGNVKMAKVLCEQDTPVIKHRDHDGNTPLIIAVLLNNPEMVTVLLNYGAFHRHSDYYCSSNPFHIALEKNYKSIVKILANYGDLVDICSCPAYPDPKFAELIFNELLRMQVPRGYSRRKRKGRIENALYHAVFYGRDYQVKRLVAAGARVNEFFYGVTPLHVAAEKRHLSIVEFLITKIKNVNLVDRINRYTALHYVSKPNRFCDTDLRQKDFEDSLKIMKILLKHGASVHVFNNFYKTPLHNAVEEQEFRPEKIQLLLDYGANINCYKTSPDCRDLTPIFFAECEAIVQMMIEKGADVNFGILESHKLATPLHYAIEKNNLKKVDILLKNGAQMNSLTIKHLKSVPEINERIIGRMMDITEALKTLIQNGHDDNNIIPILAKRHSQQGVTLNSEEFSSASGIVFSKFKECQEELARMRDFNVCNLSLLHILTMPFEKLKCCATNEEIVNVFESEIIQDKFSIYSDTIMKRFRKAKEERDLIDSSWVVLEKLIFNLHNIYLPDLVMYKILNMIDMVDLEKLVKL